MKNALIIDDHAALRMGMKMVLDEVIPGILITEAESFTSGLAAMRNEHFELVILAINFQDSGKTDMIYAIREILPTGNILILSGSDDNKHASDFINAGANGFLTKKTRIEEYKNAIQTLLKTGKYINPSV